MKTAAEITKDIRDRLAVLDEECERRRTERARLTLALDALEPRRAALKKARAAKKTAKKAGA